MPSVAALLHSPGEKEILVDLLKQLSTRGRGRFSETDLKRQVLHYAPLVVTEYSNGGYGVALTGTPVFYVFEDPPGLFDGRPEAGPMVHLAAKLGAEGKLPVARCLAEEIDEARLQALRG